MWESDSPELAGPKHFPVGSVFRLHEAEVRVGVALGLLVQEKYIEVGGGAKPGRASRSGVSKRLL